MPLAIFILAQATDGDSLLKVLGVVILIAQVVGAWAVITGRKQATEVGPQPFKVSAAEEHVSKSSFNKHLELDRKEHEKDRDEHAKIWIAIESHRSENSRKIEALIGKVDATAAVMERIGDEVRDAAHVAREAATSASVAINEARHKKV